MSIYQQQIRIVANRIILCIVESTISSPDCLFLKLEKMFLFVVKYRFDYEWSDDAGGWLKYHAMPATWDEARLRCLAEGKPSLWEQEPYCRLVGCLLSTHANRSIVDPWNLVRFCVYNYFCHFPQEPSQHRHLMKNLRHPS